MNDKENIKEISDDVSRSLDLNMYSIPFELAYIASGIWLSKDLNTHEYTKEDLYVAGLFDGEGHIGINRINRKYNNNLRKDFIQFTSRCQVASTDFELLDILKQYGGNFKENKAGKWNKNASSSLVWNIHSQQAYAFLKKIGPLLKSKRKRASARYVMAMEMSRIPKGGRCRWNKEPEIHLARQAAYNNVICINSRKSNYKDLIYDKLPHRKGFEVELVDALIRIFDIAGKFKLDLDGALEDKLEYNAKRSDHKLEARRSQNGKKF